MLPPEYWFTKGKVRVLIFDFAGGERRNQYRYGKDGFPDDEQTDRGWSNAPGRR